MQTQKFYQGTNFWIALFILVGSFFGAPESLAQQTVMAVVGLIAAGGAVRQFLPNAKFDSVKARLSDPNTWNYIVSFAATLGIPKLEELIPPLHELSDALIAGNWGMIVSRGVSLLTIVYYLFVKK